jgi:hypothetical protein
MLDIFQEIQTEFILRAHLHDDEMAIILKGHLLVEYLLNRIIRHHISKPEKAINFSFFKKLSILSEKGFVQGPLLDNIRRLNKYRNRLAHELDNFIKDEEMLFMRTDGEVIRVVPKKSKYPQRHYYRLLCHGILGQLTNHMLLELRVDPRWLEGQV